jgi:hypothetical protein
VAADHGFSTVAKDSENGARQLPIGFVAADLAAGLQRQNSSLKLFDPDDNNHPIDPAIGNSKVANGVIGTDPQFPQVVVAANGGSDLIYLPALGPKGPLAVAEKTPPGEQARIRKLGQRIVQLLLERDYVSGLFVDDTRLGKVSGALTLADGGLMGNAITPRPTIVVSFRSYVAKPCDSPRPLLCAQEISDHIYAAGAGMHGSFSRADTWNFMAARGPDFRTHYVDELPVSNADVGMTIAKLLELRLTPKGALVGRVLTEGLRGHESDPLPRIEYQTLESRPSPKGLKTILRTQAISGHRYYDVAGFAGRTVGLE